MNELQRQAYLEAMGIDSYFPRVQLPGALASPVCDMSEAAVSETPQQAAIAAANSEEQHTTIPPSPPPVKSAEGPRAAQAVLGNVVDDIAKHRPPTPAKPKRSEAVESASDIPHFALTIAKSQSGILIIDDGIQPDQDYTEYLRLLQNILFAVGAGKQALQLDPFVWPMMKTAQFDQSAEAARQTLSVYINKLIEDLSVRYVLVMGEQAQSYITANDQVSCIHTLSGLRLLSEPALKRQVWQDLQPLKRALTPPE